MRTKLSSINSRIRRPHHIGHQPLVPRRILARNHRRLRHTRMPNQRRLNLPRLNAKTTDLHLLIRPPNEVQHPIRAPARQIPGPVHPAPRSTKRVRNKPLRRHSAPLHIPTRQTIPRNVKLPHNPRRYRLHAPLQYVNPRNSGSRGLSGGTAIALCLDGKIVSGGDVRLCWAIVIMELSMWSKAPKNL